MHGKLGDCLLLSSPLTQHLCIYLSLYLSVYLSLSLSLCVLLSLYPVLLIFFFSHVYRILSKYEPNID